MSSTQPKPPSPVLFFDTVNSYQRSAAIKAAIELGLFTALAEGDGTATDAAKRCNASERGIRILADSLTVLGFMTKNGTHYQLTEDTAAFLDKRSRSYLGGTLEFFLSPHTTEGFTSMTEAVRRGGTAVSKDGTMSAEHPIWVQFARAMMPMMFPAAEALVNVTAAGASPPARVLDIAAGHGVFGLSFAKRYPNTRVTGLDWANVLQVARENAQKFGVADRYDTIPGSAFDVDWGGGKGTTYDLVLLPNFLHHFDAPSNEKILKKAKAALAPGGRVAIVEFIPNDDRITPPMAASFAMVMLSHTAGGDAYTFRELDRICRNAGLTKNEQLELPPPSQLVISRP